MVTGAQPAVLRLPFWGGLDLKRFRNEPPNAEAADIMHPDAPTRFASRYKRSSSNAENGSPLFIQQPLDSSRFSVCSSPSLSVPSSSSSSFSTTSLASTSTGREGFSRPTRSMSSPELGMESQETLINPTPLSLKFNKKSCTNCTIYQGTQPVYRISTNKDGTRTDLFDLTTPVDEGHLISTIKRREFLPDVVKFRATSQSLKVNKWLQKEKLSTGL